VKILVTGSSGFAGRWLLREIDATGHTGIATPPSSRLDITDTSAVAELVRDTRPDAIAHLAGMSFGPDARRAPDRAVRVNEGGTRAVLAAAAVASRPTPVLVVSSAEVYGNPAPADLPLRESAPLVAEQPYGLSKLAQERVASEASAGGQPVVIVRPFNHAGPGQRPEFVIPAFARRILDARAKGARTIVAGNVDVRRDFTDVRDVVRAYRLILEALPQWAPATTVRIFNIASGRAVAIREIAEAFAARAGFEVRLDIDPDLVRDSDPPEIRGDASSIAAELGWRPTIPFNVTLDDVFAEAAAEGSGRRDPQAS